MTVCQGRLAKGSETLMAFEVYLTLQFIGYIVRNTVQNALIRNYRCVMMWEVVVKCGKCTTIDRVVRGTH